MQQLSRKANINGHQNALSASFPTKSNIMLTWVNLNKAATIDHAISGNSAPGGGVAPLYKLGYGF